MASISVQERAELDALFASLQYARKPFIYRFSHSFYNFCKKYFIHKNRKIKNLNKN